MAVDSSEPFQKGIYAVKHPVLLSLIAREWAEMDSRSTFIIFEVAFSLLEIQV